MNLFPLPAGLVAVVGDEQTGKTALLRQISSAVWLDLRLPEHDELTAREFWQRMRETYPTWQSEWEAAFIDAWQLEPHCDKKLYMLSAGSRRKVALLALLCCGAQITCLDQPYAALDQAAIAVLRDFLTDVSDHPNRTWIVADYAADPSLPWRQTITLPLVT